MKIFSAILLALASLSIFGTGVALGVGLFLNRVVIDLTPLNTRYEVLATQLPAPQIPSQRIAPVATQALLIVVDGLRYDFLDVGVGLPRLVSNGASVEGALCRYVSVSYPGIASIGTGANQETHGILNNYFFAQPPPPQAESLYDVFHDAGLSTAIVDYYDPPFYYNLFKQSALGGTRMPIDNAQLPGDYDRYDDDWPIRLTNLTATVGEVFNLLYISVDEEGHSWGATSHQYLNRTRANSAALDVMLDELPSDVLLVLTADHGHVDAGGHGGLEPEVLNVPIVAHGMGVNRATSVNSAHFRFPYEQHDVAVTITYAMNVAPPRQSEGWPIFSLFNYTDADVIQYCRIVVDQRYALLNQRRANLGYPPADQKLKRFIGTVEDCDAARDEFFAASVELREQYLSQFNVKYLGWVIFAIICLVLVLLLLLMLVIWPSDKQNTIGEKLEAFFKHFGGAIAMALIYFVLLEAIIWIAWAAGWKYSNAVNSVPSVIFTAFLPNLVCFLVMIVVVGTLCACNVRSYPLQGLAVGMFLSVFCVVALVPDAANFGVYNFSSVGDPQYTFHSMVISSYFLTGAPLFIFVWFLVAHVIKRQCEYCGEPEPYDKESYPL